MPRLIVTETASRGLERCRQFLSGKSPEAAVRAGRAIEQQFVRLEDFPFVGRPYPRDPEFRELIIPFGDSGYVALYRVDPEKDEVYILAFRHQKEAGY